MPSTCLNRYISQNFLKRAFGLLIFGEMFLFGSGQILPLYGGLTLKMFNYGLMLMVSLVYFFLQYKVSRDTIQLLVLYFIITSLASLLGIINGGLGNLFLDISPLSYFLIIFFIDLYIKDISDVDFVIKILKFSTVLLAILYLIYILLIKLNVISFEVVYVFLEDTSDVMFRGDSGAFFYKGFIYLVIGLIFYIVDGELFSWKVLVLLLAIYFTHTRAFLIVVACAYLFYFIHWIHNHNYQVPVKYVVFFAIALCVFSLYASNLYVNFVGVDRSGGDAVRLQTIKEVSERISFSSLFFGHGFGVGVPIRTIHMEMSYLEIFHKQGILGLLFWVYILVKSILIFIKSSKVIQKIQLPFLLSIAIIYIQSFFNPYLNNPIGMGIVIISYVSLRKLSKWYISSYHEN